MDSGVDKFNSHECNHIQHRFKPASENSSAVSDVFREPQAVGLRQPSPCEWTYEGGRKLILHQQVATDGYRTRYQRGSYVGMRNERMYLYINLGGTAGYPVPILLDSFFYS